MTMRVVSAALILLTCLSFSAEAQILTTQEKKELKKELKAYRKDIDSYKMYKEENELNRQMIDDQAVTIQTLQLQLERKNTLIKELNDTIAYLRSLLGQGSGFTPGSTTEFPEGTVYQVQVGVFKYFDIRDLLSNPKFFRTEEVDGMVRYSIGYFEDYEDATNFKAKMRAMGLSDAFVTTYTDGERVYEGAPPARTYQPTDNSPSVLPASNSTNSDGRTESIEINTGYQSGSGDSDAGTTDEGEYEWIIVTDGKGNTGRVKRLKDDEL